MTNMIDIIREFVETFTISEFIPEMEQGIQKSIAYSQFVGTRQNEIEAVYHIEFEGALDRLSRAEDETETTRRAKLNSWTAPRRRELQDLKLLNGNLRAIRMSLMLCIKTRREEP